MLAKFDPLLYVLLELHLTPVHRVNKVDALCQVIFE